FWRRSSCVPFSLYLLIIHRPICQLEHATTLDTGEIDPIKLVCHRIAKAEYTLHETIVKLFGCARIQYRPGGTILRPFQTPIYRISIGGIVGGSQCISVGHGGLIEFNLQPEGEWESRQQELCLWIAIKDESRRFYCCRTIRMFVRSGKGNSQRRKLVFMWWIIAQSLNKIVGSEGVVCRKNMGNAIARFDINGSRTRRHPVAHKLTLLGLGKPDNRRSAINVSG